MSEPLTTRELEILLLFCDDRMNKEVADALGLSRKTVEKHKAHIYEKLGCHTAMGMLKAAVRLGLVNLEPPTNISPVTT